MISQQGSVTVGNLKQGPRRWRRIAGSAFLAVAAVAVVGVIGAWQVRERSTPGTMGREAAVPAVGAASGSAAAAITSGPAASILYLVDSAEEATLIRAFPGGVDQMRSQGGASPVQTAVLVGSTLDRAALEQLPGTPGTRIIDLRAPAPTATATDALARELDALTASSLGVPFAR